MEFLFFFLYLLKDVLANKNTTEDKIISRQIANRKTI